MSIVPLPKINARQVISALLKRGFVLSRQSGSHKIYKNEKEKRATVHFHGNKILHPKVLKSIMKDTDLSVEEFTRLLRS